MWSRLAVAGAVFLVFLGSLFLDWRPAKLSGSGQSPRTSVAPQFASVALAPHALPAVSDRRDIFFEASAVLDSAPLRDWSVPNFETTSRAAVAVVLAGGAIRADRVLYQKNLLERVPIASITKLMTAMVALENTTPAELETAVVVSRRAATTDGQSAGLVMGERIRVQDLLSLMLVASANDAAVALAEQVGVKLAAPDEDPLGAFVRAMNIRSRVLGLTDTSFANPAGLDDPNNYSTAADLIELAKATFRYPAIWLELGRQRLELTSLSNRRHAVRTTNELLGVLAGFEGGKTGFTAEAGASMVGMSRVGPAGVQVVTVVLGSADRFGETRRLIEWLGQAYRW